MKPNGWLFIEVPDVSQPFSGHFDRFYQKAHLFHFSPETLRKLLYKTGFEPVYESRFHGFLVMLARLDENKASAL